MKGEREAVPERGEASGDPKRIRVPRAVEEIIGRLESRGYEALIPRSRIKKFIR